MRYNTIRKMDVSNGPGVRVSIFTQGCPHHCPNCFNPETWDEDGGKIWTPEINDKIIELAKPAYIKGLSVLGGEPFFEYFKDTYSTDDDMLLDLVIKFKKEYPEKTIWLWTGYIWDKICQPITNTEEKIIPRIFKVLKHLDVVVDGPYIESKKNITLPYAGSENQRVIDVQKTLVNKSNKIIMY